MHLHKKQKRQFWIILLIVFLGFLGISMPYLIFPALFLNPSFSILSSEWGETSRALFLGITLASYPLGQFIGSPILGSLSDDYGRKPILWGSLIFTAVFNLITAFAIEWQSLSMLISSRFLAGLMEGNIAIARAMASDFTTISKHKTFGKINAMASIAYLIGPLIGGLLTDKSLFEGLQTSTPFYFICLLFLCLACLSGIFFEAQTTSSVNEPKSFQERINIVKRLSTLFLNKRLQFLMVTSTCFTLAVDIFYEFCPVYLTVKWSLSPSQLVFYNGVLCLALAAGNGWLPSFFSSGRSNRLAILYSIGGFSLFLIGIVMTNSTFLMIVLFGLSGLAIGIAATLLTVSISNSVSNNIQGEVMGVQISLRVLGDAIVCLLGGILLLLSPKLILIAAAILSLAALSHYFLKLTNNSI